VIVHIEQMALDNPHAKKFSIELGKLLQRQVGNVDTCVVKLSQPHVHRAGGPIFRMGKKIVDTLNLTPATYQPARGQRKRPADEHRRSCKKEATCVFVILRMRRCRARFRSVPLNSEYKKKKRMSAAVFKYFVEADELQQEDLKINITSEFQLVWKGDYFSRCERIKLDDVGDALLHALNDILCGGSNYKQLLPAASALHSNRTVAVAIYPTQAFWAVIHCTWNAFELENFGVYRVKTDRPLLQGSRARWS
jgi:hypothetical protein